MRHAKLPNARVRRAVADMRDDETAWAVPWVLHIDHNDNCWLDPTGSIGYGHDREHNLMIMRAAGEYHVWLPANYTWYRGGAGRDPEMIPVAGVHEDGDQ